VWGGRLYCDRSSGVGEAAPRFGALVEPIIPRAAVGNPFGFGSSTLLGEVIVYSVPAMRLAMAGVMTLEVGIMVGNPIPVAMAAIALELLRVIGSYGEE